MSVFDEKSPDFKNLPKEFQSMVRFVNRGRDTLKGLTPSEEASQSPEDLKRNLKTSKEIIERQFRLIEKFVSLPTDAAIVLAIVESGGKKFAWLLHNGRRRKVNYPDKVRLVPGMLVEVSSQTAQIIDEAKIANFGPIAKVSKLTGSGNCEVNYNSETKSVLCGAFGPNGIGLSLKIGDRIVLDQLGIIILANLGQEENRFKFKTEPKITWDDIVGLDNVKEQLVEIIELPYTHAGLFRHHNKKPVKGVLLYGPPGNGKSMLLEASASAMVGLHGRKVLESGYIHVKAAELLEELVGRGEKNIKYIFEQGEAHFEKYGYPAIIAIEEPDAVFIKRGTGKSSDVERSMVDAFLAEMNYTHSVVMLATNRPDILDPALLRDKRIDRKIYVGRPNEAASAKIIEMNLKGAPLEEDTGQLAKYAASEIFSGRFALYEITRKSGGVMKLCMQHIINGGMAANVAEEAKSISFKRDVASNTKSSTGRPELTKAIEIIFEGNAHLDHLDEIRDFVRDFKDDVEYIKPLRQVR